MTQADVFAQPFSYWVGMDTDPRTTPQALAEFNHFYSTTHVSEVIAAHPGFVGASRYELVDSAPPDASRGGPRWLAVYGMADEAAAVRYLEDNERPWLHRRRYSPWPPARRRAKTVWRLLWRQTATAGSLTRPAELVFLRRLSVSPELVLRSGFARATGFELYRAFAPAESESWRFCEIHETDTDVTPAAVDLRSLESSEVFGPLLYRRIRVPQ